MPTLLTQVRHKLGDGTFVEKSARLNGTYPLNTPWGVPDSITEYAPGIAFYSTPSHGGMYLSPDRRAQVPAAWNAYAQRWVRGGPGWYEEDCAWAAVALTWPELFEERDLEMARKTQQHFFPN